MHIAPVSYTHLDVYKRQKLHDIVIVTEHKNSIFKKVKTSGAYFH